MRLNSPQINLITKACMKASRSLIRDFGEIENLQVSSKGPGDFVSSMLCLCENGRCWDPFQIQWAPKWFPKSTK